MGSRYTNIVDHIQKQTYQLDDVPDTYGPTSAYFLDKDTCGPVFDPMEGSVGRGRYTISNMITMFDDGVPFEIIDDMDVIRIAVYTCHYANYLDQHIGSLKNATLLRTKEKTDKFKVVILRAAERIRRMYEKQNAGSAEDITLLDQVRSIWDARNKTPGIVDAFMKGSKS